MKRIFLHTIMLLPILAATVLTFSSEPVATLAPEQVVSWNEWAAANQALAASTIPAAPEPVEFASN
jgi:hypothetical protein